MDAWYMVSEYHLNLGPNDTLEKIVIRLSEISDLKPSESKEKILQYLSECKDPVVLKHKSMLTNMVPYRLHAPFLQGSSSSVYDVPGGLSCLIERLNHQPDLIYYFSPPKRMETGFRHGKSIFLHLPRWNTLPIAECRRVKSSGKSSLNVLSCI